jgi:hypothetical protein
MKINFKEVLQFFALFGVLFVVSILFRNTAENMSRFVIIAIACGFYFVWGIWHHSSKERTNKIIVLEYALVSFLITLLAAMGLGVVRFF